MRIKVVQTPSMPSVDGIDLRRFQPGIKYEVGNRLGELFLAAGWGEPVPDDEPAPLIPFSEGDPFVTRTVNRDDPHNLVRETYPPDWIALASDRARRKRPRQTDDD